MHLHTTKSFQAFAFVGFETGVGATTVIETHKHVRVCVCVHPHNLEETMRINHSQREEAEWGRDDVGYGNGEVCVCLCTCTCVCACVHAVVCMIKSIYMGLCLSLHCWLVGCLRAFLCLSVCVWMCCFVRITKVLELLLIFLAQLRGHKEMCS